MRKASVLPAALGAVFTLLIFPATLEARSAKARHPKHSLTHQAATAQRNKTRTLIHQNQVGEVVIDRVEVVGMNLMGPTLPGQPHNYPQPICEPADTIAEVRVHDAAENPDTLEVETAQVSREVSRSAHPALSRIAERLGSFFRPKSADARVKPEDVDLDVLLSQGLLIPVAGVDVERLRDSFLSQRGRYAKHLAIDIGAPRGTPVLATTDGEIIRVTRESRGGKSIYQKDATGQYLLFYCHLSRYAEDAKPGRRVHKGDVIGYVGATGHVIGGPHLHFSITRLPADSGNFKAGLAINPYLLFLAGVP